MAQTNIHGVRRLSAIGRGALAFAPRITLLGWGLCAISAPYGMCAMPQALSMLQKFSVRTGHHSVYGCNFWSFRTESEASFHILVESIEILSCARARLTSLYAYFCLGHAQSCFPFYRVFGAGNGSSCLLAQSFLEAKACREALHWMGHMHCVRWALCCHPRQWLSSCLHLRLRTWKPWVIGGIRSAIAWWRLTFLDHTELYPILLLREEAWSGYGLIRCLKADQSNDFCLPCRVEWSMDVRYKRCSALWPPS